LNALNGAGIDDTETKIIGLKMLFAVRTYTLFEL